MRKTLLLAAASITLALPGCGNWQQSLAAFGAAGCGAAAAGFGGGGSSSRVARGIAAGGACAMVGSVIGRSLDERDRQQVNFATARALQQRLPPQYYRPGYQAGSYQVAGGYGGALPSEGSSARSRSPSRSSSSAATDQNPPAGTGRFPGLAPVQGAQWVSDHSGATGSVEVISAEKPRDGHGECRSLVQTVRQPGETSVSETAKFCESRPGANDWMKI